MIWSQNQHLVLKPKGHALILQSGKLNRRPLSFRVEALRATREIAQAAGAREILIFLSGGMDSETVAQAFLKSGVRFRPVIICFENGLNHHEVEPALKFCRRHRLKPQIISFDLGRYVRSKWAKDVADRYPSFIAYQVLMKVMTHLHDGRRLFVLGTAEPEGVYRRGRAFLNEFSDDVQLSLFCSDRKLPAVCNFFFWSPELYMSILMSAPYCFFIEQRGSLYVHTKPLKEDLFQSTFKVKKRRKHNGMELARTVYANELTALEKSLKGVQRLTYFSWSGELRRLASGLVASPPPGNKKRKL